MSRRRSVIKRGKLSRGYVSPGYSPSNAIKSLSSNCWARLMSRCNPNGMSKLSRKGILNAQALRGYWQK